MDEDANSQTLPDPLVATLADPAGHAARVPYLLGLLDGEDPEVRLAAGTALCLVAATDHRLRGVVAERLVDRLGEGTPVEVGHAVNYLAARYPTAVEEALSTLDAERRTRVSERLAESGGDGRRPGAGIDPDWTVVRTGEPSERDDGEDERGETGADPSLVGDHEETAVRAGRHVTGGQSRNRRGRDDPRQGEQGADGDRNADGEDGAAGDASTGGVTAETLQTVSRHLSEVVAASRFDDLTVLSDGRRDRYGDVYRAVGRLDGTDYAVALTVYRERGTHASFVGAFESVIEAWHEVSDHRAVLPVYDWSPRPHPWATIEYAGESLARHGDPGDPLWTVLELAAAVVHVHQHGVCHGAIDPGNVVYRDAELDGTDRQPLLTNVGVASLPDEDGEANRPVPRGVDPRYAAPEHYDEDYGRVDGATDVYGLGALLHRLVTGEHPYSGDSAVVRERVLSAPCPLPSRVDPDLPDALDDVLRKATAKRKIKRYETVQAFERELRQVADAVGGEGDAV